MNQIFHSIKPGVPKRYLLLVAAIMWFSAGTFLIIRGEFILPGFEHFWPRLLVVIVAGMAMFFLIFIRLSLNHIRRINAIEIIKPCIFSFFDFKGYLMMLFMITLGVTLRKTHVITAELLSYFYFTMSIPLILSAIRFFLAWRNYKSLT